MATGRGSLPVKICGACLATGDEIKFVNMGYNFWSFAKFCGDVNYYNIVWVCHLCSFRIKKILHFRLCIKKATTVLNDILQGIKKGRVVDYDNLTKKRDSLNLAQLSMKTVHTTCELDNNFEEVNFMETVKYPSFSRIPEKLTTVFVEPSIYQKFRLKSESPTDEIALLELTKEPEVPPLTVDAIKELDDIKSETHDERSFSGNDDDDDDDAMLVDLLPKLRSIKVERQKVKRTKSTAILLKSKKDKLEKVSHSIRKKPKNFKKPGSVQKRSKETKDPKDNGVEVVSFNMPKETVRLEMAQKRLEKRFTEAKYKCVSCVKVFPIETELNLHMERHTEVNGEFLCELCLQYVKNKHKHNELHCRRYKCTRCDFNRPAQLSIINHYHKEHKNDEETHCQDCDRTFLNATFEVHVCKKVMEKCDKCDKVMLRRSLYMHHLLVHADKQHKCDNCEAAFSTLKHLMIHKSDCRPYYCTDCDKFFKSKKNLALHINKTRKHDRPDKLRQCELCSAKVPPYRFRKHMDDQHPQQGRYSCSKCTQVFDTTVQYQRHRAVIHPTEYSYRSREKIHVCDFCAKAFPEKAALTDHMNIHTGARPYKCFHCEATFGFKAARYSHIRIIHMKIKKKRQPKKRKPKLPVDNMEALFAI